MRWQLAILATFCMFGCGADDGPGYVSVDGVVLLEGKPVEGAVVTFSPEAGAGNTGQVSMGLTDADGNFTLKTGTGKRGAAIGNHKVAVELAIAVDEPAEETSDGLAPELPNEMQAAPKTKSTPKTVFVIPEKYRNPLTSGLTATVTSAGLQGHKIELTR